MDRVTRCLHCGKRMVPTPSYTGRTDLKCVFCDRLDPVEMAEPARWGDSPLPFLFPVQSLLERACPQRPSELIYNSPNSGGSNQLVSDSPPSITIAAPVT
jgi:hypothetical protein